MKYVLLAVLLVACTTQAPVAQTAPSPHPTPLPLETPEETTSAEPTPEQTTAPPVAGEPSTVDLTALPLGDLKISSAPKVGYLFSCQKTFTEEGGAGTDGPWIHGSTWDKTAKVSVSGAVTWPHEVAIAIANGKRQFHANALPEHTTGTFPIQSSDDAYAYDRNPNSIKAQTLVLELDTNPTVQTPSCVGGEVGISIQGVPIFSAFDAGGRDAPAHEVQDECEGHPQVAGEYHYHSWSDCYETSGLLGYALDGFGIYGPEEDGKRLATAALDECHGHTHTIEWDGQTVSMYHYHFTDDFPYSVGCFRGNAVQPPKTGTQPSQQEQQPSQQPPQAAFDACTKAGKSCSFTDNGRTVQGTCRNVPEGLVCAPQR